MSKIQVVITPEHPGEEYHEFRGSSAFKFEPVHVVDRHKQSALRPTDPEDALLAAAVRARLAGFTKRDAVDLIIDVYATVWSD